MKNEIIKQNNSHIDIKYHCVRDLVKENKIRLNYIIYYDNLANGFTRHLNSNDMKKFRNSIMYEF